jgi:hypothetical protein
MTFFYYSILLEISTNNKIDIHDITEILLNVTLNTIAPSINLQNFFS